MAVSEKFQEKERAGDPLNPQRQYEVPATKHQKTLLEDILHTLKTTEAADNITRQVQACLENPELTQTETRKILQKTLRALETLQEINWMCQESLFRENTPLQKHIKQEIQNLHEERTRRRNLLLQDHLLHEKKTCLSERIKNYNPLKVLETRPEGKTYRVSLNGSSQIIHTTWGDDPFTQGF